MEKKKKYSPPQTLHFEVELESGFLKASIFEKGEGHDKGVSINGHQFGNTGNYFDGKAPSGSGMSDEQWNSWDNI